jgi:hypothetical protein
MSWLGTFNVADISDQQLEELAEQITDAWFPEANDAGSTSSATT